jgi:hypothetical protein
MGDLTPRQRRAAGKAAGKALCRAARLLGAFPAAFWIFVVVASLFQDPGLPEDPESIVMTILIFSSLIAMAVAWYRELPGGILLLAVALAHAVNALIVAGHNRGFAVLVSGGPFLVVGLLFVLCGWRRRQRSHQEVAERF